jgi:hypothetical protein
MTRFKFALYDEEGNVIRFLPYESQGALPYPLPTPQLSLTDPEWDNPLF